MINIINAVFAEVFDAERVSLIMWKSISICLIPAMTWYSKIKRLKRTNVLKKIELLYASIYEMKEVGLSKSILK
ncbi:hypothetical protein N9403_05850, partial [Gammaproteobacteria bacterium]|nr:hypothetical protein [Gammaproteobacteria bacterium]